MISMIICEQYSIQNHTLYSVSAYGSQSVVNQPSLSAPSQDAARLMDSLSIACYTQPKLGEAYTRSDAIQQLWVDAHTINLNDPNDTVRASGTPAEEDLAQLTWQAEAGGLNGQINFSRVSGDFSRLFSAVHAGNLGDVIDYLASRAVALEGQVNRNYTGEALQSQMQELSQVIQYGQDKLIDSYTNRLQAALGLSDSDAQTVRSTLETLISQRIQTYQTVQTHMPDTLTGTRDEWLLNQNQYMASQLREAVGAITDSASGGELTLGDLRAAGEIAGAYQAVYQQVCQGSGGNEAILALDLSMIDMKTETLIQKRIVSGTMAEMLRGSLEQRHQTAMDFSDKRLAALRETALSEGPKPDLDRKLFQSIYDVVLGSFHQNGGDALAAIRDGVTFGKTATARASENNPKVSRWAISMDDYWNRFYTSSEVSDWHGGTTTQRSEYEKYAGSWEHFAATISGSNERFLASSSQDIPSYGQHSLLDVTG